MKQIFKATAGETDAKQLSLIAGKFGNGVKFSMLASYSKVSLQCMTGWMWSSSSVVKFRFLPESWFEQILQFSETQVSYMPALAWKAYFNMVSCIQIHTISHNSTALGRITFVFSCNSFYRIFRNGSGCECRRLNQFHTVLWSKLSMLLAVNKTLSDMLSYV